MSELRFASAAGVPDAVWATVTAESSQIEQPWWAEPITLAARPAPGGPIEGWSKVPPMSIETANGGVVEIPVCDWCFMTLWDTRIVLAALSGWSRRFGLDWLLTAEGERFGRIRRGEADRRVTRNLAWYAREGRATGDESVDRARAVALRQRYELLL